MSLALTAMWPQPLDPLHSTVLSALVAALPLILVLVLITAAKSPYIRLALFRCVAVSVVVPSIQVADGSSAIGRYHAISQSLRSDCMGSIRLARRAGMNPAHAAAVVSASVAAMTVAGSWGSKP